MPEKTRREEIAEFLELRVASVKEVAKFFEMRFGKTLDDIQHVRKSYSARFEITPARCIGCGFVYEDRDRLTTPSRCPECKSERIDGPWCHIASD